MSYMWMSMSLLAGLECIAPTQTQQRACHGLTKADGPGVVVSNEVAGDSFPTMRYGRKFRDAQAPPQHAGRGIATAPLDRGGMPLILQNKLRGICSIQQKKKNRRGRAHKAKWPTASGPGRRGVAGRRSRKACSLFTPVKAKAHRRRLWCSVRATGAVFQCGRGEFGREPGKPAKRRRHRVVRGSGQMAYARRRFTWEPQARARGRRRRGERMGEGDRVDWKDPSIQLLVLDSSKSVALRSHRLGNVVRRSRDGGPAARSRHRPQCQPEIDRDTPTS